MLDATRLRVLVAVARHGSVTAAAHALNYAQPSISHHIARLEAETGAKLMERAGRGVRLTEAGQLLAERATEILGRLDAAEAELAAHLGLRQDRVRLAAPGLAVATLVAAAAALQTERPTTELMVTQAEPAAAVRMLRDSEADVALTSRWLYLDDPDSGRIGHDDDLHQQLLIDEPLFLVSRSSESGSGAKPLCLADYARHRWIAYGGQADEFLLRLCRADGHFVPHIAVRTGDYVAAQALAAAGLGVTVLPGLARRAPGLPGVDWAELDGGRHQLFAVTYPAAQPTPAVSWLVEALMRAAPDPR